MTRIRTAIRLAAGIAFAAAPLLALLAPANAAARNGRLSTPYAYTIGDDIAIRMEAVFRSTAGLESAAMVVYDRKAQNLVGDIYGSTEEVDAAKRELEGYMDAFHDLVAPYAKKRHAVDLKDTDVTLIYFNDTGEEPPYEVLRWENGSYTEPPAATRK